MSKIILKECTIPFYKKIEVDGEETLERHDLSFAQGTMILATLAVDDGDPIIEYHDMYAMFNEDVMEVVDENPPRATSCCGKKNGEN